MDKLLDGILEKTLDKALALISLENLSDLDLSPPSYWEIDPEQAAAELDLLLSRFSNVDVAKKLRTALETYKVSKNFLDFQWIAANELSELGERPLNRLIKGLERETLSDPIRAIPQIAAALVLYKKIGHEHPDDVAFVKMKDEILSAVEILAGNGRVTQALEILREIDIPSILREGKTRFLDSTLLVGDPTVAATILQRIDPEARLLPLRGAVLSRLVKAGRFKLAAALAQGRDEKGDVPSLYFTLPIAQLQKGDPELALRTAKTLFPESKLLLQFVNFAWIWCRDNAKLETFEVIAQKIGDIHAQNGAYINLFAHFMGLGLVGLAEPYGKKIDFDACVQGAAKGTSPRLVSKALGQIHPALQKMAEDHFGL